MPSLVLSPPEIEQHHIASPNEIHENNTHEMSGKVPHFGKGLAQITSQSDVQSTRNLGVLNTPLGGKYSIGNLISTLSRIPGNLLSGIGNASQAVEESILSSDEMETYQPNIHTLPSSNNYEVALHGVGSLGRIITGIGTISNAVVGATAGFICLGEMLLTRAFHFCLGKDVSINARMGQTVFPREMKQKAINELQLCNHVMRNEGKENSAPASLQALASSQLNLPENYRLAQPSEVPHQWRRLYNSNTGIIQTNLSIPVGMGVFVDEGTNTLKLAFRGITNEPRTQIGAITGSLYSDTFMRTARSIAEDFQEHHTGIGSKSIELIGHSLGGEAVEYAGAMTGLKTTAYNSAGLSALTRSEIGINRINYANITNVNTQRDWLSQDLIRSTWVPRAQIGSNQYIFEEDTRRTQGNAHFVEAMIDGLRKY
ncbi:hypothetical protein [Shewanella surugensis]|uniref:Fungal lipase-like domain-containing protein n=1 Tax=Shewanella surugensis TaxID=212020 RepID=A0ABT0LJ22_9GAMM|nr:hypothetical protein [Shewanella surugensis]MCL1127711.1 hypothetical protein [Shewanella surugensis]